LSIGAGAIVARGLAHFSTRTAVISIGLLLPNSALRERQSGTRSNQPEKAR
jgi:hypothetical protein